MTRRTVIVSLLSTLGAALVPWRVRRKVGRTPTLRRDADGTTWVVTTRNDAQGATITIRRIAAVYGTNGPTAQPS